MAKKAADAATSDAPVQASAPTRFTRQKLCENATKLFGVGPHVLEGALHGQPDMLTMEQATRALDAWQRRPVAPPPAPVKRRG